MDRKIGDVVAVEVADNYRLGGRPLASGGKIGEGAETDRVGRSVARLHGVHDEVIERVAEDGNLDVFQAGKLLAEVEGLEIREGPGAINDAVGSKIRSDCCSVMAVTDERNGHWGLKQGAVFGEVHREEVERRTFCKSELQRVAKGGLDKSRAVVRQAGSCCARPGKGARTF